MLIYYIHFRTLFNILFNHVKYSFIMFNMFNNNNFVKHRLIRLTCHLTNVKAFSRLKGKSSRLTRNIIFFFFDSKVFLMSFRFSRNFKILLNRVNKKSFVVMIICTRYASKQKKYRMLLLSRKCEKCI